MTPARNNKPTDGALRAAKQIEHNPLFLQSTAEIIDRETGVRELTDILENIITEAGDLIESRSPELAAQARAALRRYADELVNLKLRDFIVRVAEENNISVQSEVTTGGAEDSAELQRFEAGKPAVNFAVAARYLHSHNSMIERGDLDRAVNLLVKILPRLDAKTVAEISRF